MKFIWKLIALIRLLWCIIVHYCNVYYFLRKEYTKINSSIQLNKFSWNFHQTFYCYRIILVNGLYVEMRKSQYGDLGHKVVLSENVSFWILHIFNLVNFLVCAFSQSLKWSKSLRSFWLTSFQILKRMICRFHLSS